MFTEAQFNTLDVVDAIIVHFDATGSVVRKPNDIRCKRIMYYAIEVPNKHQTKPIAEMVSAQHDIGPISIFLKKYRNFLENLKEN